MAKAKKQRPQTSPPSTKAFTIKLVLISFVMIVLIKHSFIFLISGMLPTIVAYIVDRSPNRHQFKVVGAMNFSGVAPYLAELMKNQNEASAVQAMVGDPGVWLVMYLAASAGWLLVIAAPSIARATLEMFSDNKVNRLEGEQDKLVEEWGPEVKSLSNAQRPDDT